MSRVLVHVLVIIPLNPMDRIKGSYTKEEGMQLIETAKFERLLKIA